MSPAPPDQAAAFASHYYLSLLDPQTTRLFMTKGRSVSWRPGRPVMKAGGPADEVLFLFEGSLRLSLPSQATNGVLISFLRAPSVFGVAEAILQARSIVRLTSVTQASGLLVPAALFADAWRRTPALARLISRDVSWHLRLSQAQLRVAILGDTPARLAQLFLAYATLGVAPSPNGGSRLLARLGQFQLADDLGLSRNAVRRALRQLDGLVSKERGRFVLRDEKALQKLVGPSLGLYVPEAEYRYESP